MPKQRGENERMNGEDIRSELRACGCTCYLSAPQEPKQFEESRAFYFYPDNHVVDCAYRRAEYKCGATQDSTLREWNARYEELINAPDADCPGRGVQPCQFHREGCPEFERIKADRSFPDARGDFMNIAEKAGRERLRELRTLKGGHPESEHGCTRACLMPAGTKEYICTEHGEVVYGDEPCPKCGEVSD